MFTYSSMNETFEFIHHAFIIVGSNDFHQSVYSKTIRGEGDQCKLMLKSRDYFDGFNFF